MRNDLSKKDKKQSRELISKGIRIEFERGLKEFDGILQKWKNDDGASRDTYNDLYAAIKDFNKYINIMYDKVGSPQYFDVVVHQLASDLYDINETDGFSAAVKEDILQAVKLRKQYWEEGKKKQAE